MQAFAFEMIQFFGNNPRHSFTSRMLYTCISSRLFDGEKTLRDLNTAWAKEMEDLFFNGVEVWTLKIFQYFCMHERIICIALLNVYICTKASL